MVMKRNMMRKNLFRSIQKSIGRYVAMVAIIALGCCLFVALRVTKADMVETGQQFTDQQNMFDLQLLSSYGWSEDNLQQIQKLPGVQDAEGSIYLDAIVYFDYKNSEGAYRLYSIPERINKVHLLGGRMPVNGDECLVDGDGLGEWVIGTTITVVDGNAQDTLDSLQYRTYTIVGYVSTPLYMDMTRGSTTLGNGSLVSYVYLPEEAFDVDYYTEIYVTIPGDHRVYSQAYTDALDEASKQLESHLLAVADDRFQVLKNEAEKLWSEGQEAYLSGLKEYQDQKAEAEKALADALAELTDGQIKFDEGWAQFLDGEKQLLDAQAQLDAARGELDAGAIELEYAKAEAYEKFSAAYTTLFENYKTVRENLALVEDGLLQIQDGLLQIEDGLTQIEENQPLLELMIQLLETSVKTTQASLDAAKLTGNILVIEPLQNQLDDLTAQLNEYQGQMDTLVQTKEMLLTTQQELTTQQAELVANKKLLDEALLTIDLGFTELETNEKKAESEFAAAAAKIAAGYLELEAGQKEVTANMVTLEESRKELMDAKAQMEAGWEEYESGKQEAETKFAEAEEKLKEAEAELADGRKTIDDMAEPVLYTLTRNTNAGYLALDSNSDIVEGISKVLPVFFLLIASLVCITTMTRMVEEERTQIGTLKALGYSSGAIMSKYLWYSASAALIGCTLGVLAGSYILPVVLWDAYSMLFNITPDMVLLIDWETSIGTTLSYVVVSTLVTWYSCYKTLQEVPAELIRPKAGKLGKKIFLEYLPFWQRFSFLNKVMLRNIFRYGQRFAMMIIGIGGCTALLLTGYGIQDSIGDLANIQFEEVSVHDMQIYFDGEMDQQAQEDFYQSVKNNVQSVGYFYQTSGQLKFDGQARDVYMICSDDGITEFMDFHKDGNAVPMPGTGEALLSIGAAELLGIQVGDQVTILDSDLRSMTLTISGIYENHVYNYLIITPETMRQQWNEEPAYQMAFVKIRDTANLDAVSQQINNMDNVLSVIVNADNAKMVGDMMEALDMVVWVIILSAGMLAAIVLYNLTNININERIREIATIKVLGFNAGETASYVFKENILLTVLGVIFGLGLGVWFLDFVMMNVKIDMVWFATRINFPSYIYSVLLTLLCATVVDFIFYFLLDKINMAEALKSVE